MTTQAQEAQVQAALKARRLVVVNFKKIRNVDISLDGDVSLVLLTGRNGQGKTSVLDAFMAACADARNLPDVPLRQGAREGRIFIDFGDITVERVFKSKGSNPPVIVKAANGARYPNPQAMLNALYSRISFDPLAFMRMERKAQVKQLLSVVDIGFDPAEMDKAKAALDAEFTEAGRQVEKYKGALAAMPVPALPPGTPEVNLTELTERYRQASAAHAEYSSRLAGRERQDELVQQGQRRFTDLQEQIARLKEELEQTGITLNHNIGVLHQLDAQLKEEAKALPDQAIIAEEMAGAEERNRAVREAAKYYETENALEAAEDARARLKQAREAHDTKRDELLSAARMPVEGLGFDSEGLTLNGIPLEQASASEQLRVSVAIAMAANPRMRDITIRDGSLLDSAAIESIKQQAEANGYRLWVEQMNETGEVGLVFEDGLIVADNRESAEGGADG